MPSKRGRHFRGTRVVGGGAKVAERRKRVYMCGGECGEWWFEKPDQCQKCGRIDFIHFDSYAEFKRYMSLRLLEKAGKISELKRQPRFDLHAPSLRSAPPVKIGTYVADFGYLEDAIPIVDDVKGNVTTDLAAWKIRHAEAEYGIRVKIVKG